MNNDTLEQRIAHHMVQEIQANMETLTAVLTHKNGQDLLAFIQLSLSLIKDIYDDYSKHVNTLASLREWLDDLDFDEREREQ